MASPSRQDIVWNIGDWVQSTHAVEFVYDGNNRVVNRVPRTTHGQVVGGRWRQVGRYKPGYPGTWAGEDSEPEFRCELQVFVYLVREGFLNKPIEVLASDVKPAAAGVMRRMKTRLHDSGDAYRAALSEAAKVQPRRNGKFVGTR